MTHPAAWKVRKQSGGLFSRQAAAMALAVIGPMPGTVCRRLATSFDCATALILAVIPTAIVSDPEGIPRAFTF